MPNKVEQYAIEINAVIATMRKSSITFFGVLKKARQELSAKEYDELLPQIEMERSTLVKITKIFECNAVMNNLERLPARWGTLYEMAKLADYSKETFVEKLKDGTFNPKTSKADVLAVRHSKYCSKPEVFITLRLRPKGGINDEVRKEVEDLECFLSKKFEVKSNLKKLLKDAA